MGRDSMNHTPDFSLIPENIPSIWMSHHLPYTKIIAAKLWKVIYIHSMMFGQADQLLVNGIRLKDNNRCHFATKAIYDLFKLPW